MCSIEIGTIVWAKFRGYPWWPSKVESEENMSPKFLSYKPKTPLKHIPVYVYGKDKHAWANTKYIKPFEKYKDIFITGKRTEMFDNAIKKALNEIRPKKNLNLDKASTSSINQNINKTPLKNQQSNRIINKTPSQKGNQAQTEQRNQTPSEIISPSQNSDLTNKTPSQHENQISSEIESQTSASNPSENKTQSQIGTPTSNTKKSSKIINSTTPSGKETVPLVPVKKEIIYTPTRNKSSEINHVFSPETEKSLKSKDEELAKKFEGDEFAERVVKIRIKLQKVMKRELNQQILKYVNTQLMELEKREYNNIDLDLLRYSKIGKVIKFLAHKKEFPPSDKYNIKNRCLLIYNHWKGLINGHERSSQFSENVVDSPSIKSDIGVLHATNYHLLSSPNPSHYSEGHNSYNSSRSHIHSHQHSSHRHSSRHHSSRYNPYRVNSNSSLNSNSRSNSNQNDRQNNVIPMTIMENDNSKNPGELDNDNYNIISNRFYGNTSPSNSHYSNNSFYSSPSQPTYKSYHSLKH